MPLWILNAWGWVWAHKRLVLYIAAGLGLLLLLVFVFRSCGGKSAKIDLETVDKINSKNEAEAKKAVRDAVVENANVVMTVDNRSTLAETNIVERDRLIEEKLKVVNQKVAEAKAGGGNVTGPELECILIPENCQ